VDAHRVEKPADLAVLGVTARSPQDPSPARPRSAPGPAAVFPVTHTPYCYYEVS